MSVRQTEMLTWLTRTLTMVSIGVGAWFAQMVLSEIRDLADEQARTNHAMEQRVRSLEVSQAATDARRFTAHDASVMQSALAATLAGLDKRVTRNEDALSRIQQTLERIDKRLASP